LQQRTKIIKWQAAGHQLRLLKLNIAARYTSLPKRGNSYDTTKPDGNGSPMNFDITNIWRDTMRALGFLTRLPVPSRYFQGDDGTLSTACRAFPFAALIGAIPTMVILFGATLLSLPPLLAALLALATQIIVSGALHEDGLADVADGFFGGRDKERRLEIMKDSSIGTFGALALIITFSVRTIAIAAILQVSLIAAIFAILAATVLGKGALVWHWSNSMNAKSDGVAAKVGAPTKEAQEFALGCAIIVGTLCALVAGNLTRTIFTLAFITLVTSLFDRLAKDKIGGHSGDTLGSAAIIAEMACLIGLASGI
jgi:adenosylcobinamide-GDP ribazoletransferase